MRSHLWAERKGSCRQSGARGRQRRHHGPGPGKVTRNAKTQVLLRRAEQREQAAAHERPCEHRGSAHGSHKSHSPERCALNSS